MTLDEFEDICFAWVVDAADKEAAWLRLQDAFPQFVLGPFEKFWNRHKHKKHHHHHHHNY